jgi:hypothetical protein
VIRAPFLWLLVPLVFTSNRALADNDTISGLAWPSMAAPDAAARSMAAPDAAARSMAAPDAAGSPEDSVFVVPAPPVVIEGEPSHLEPTPEQLIERFRESLAAPPSFLSSERRLADGTIEATTKLGRFCAPPLPAQSVSGAGGDIRLVARCASF